MNDYSETPKHFLFEDLGPCWTTPPQKLTDPMFLIIPKNVFFWIWLLGVYAFSEFLISGLIGKCSGARAPELKPFKASKAKLT